MENLNNLKLFDFGITLNVNKLSDVLYKVPKLAGVYVVYENDKMLKIGKSENLLQRLGGYYACGRRDCEFSKYINYENRDNMVVQWKVYSDNSCSDIESILKKITEYCNIELPCWKRK